MNIEFKENFFRFIFPTALFWSLVVTFTEISPIGSEDSYIIFILYFMTTGFVINALGSILLMWIIHTELSEFKDPKREIFYWRKIADETRKEVSRHNNQILKETTSNIVERKIERRWDLFTANVNAFTSVVAFLIFYSTAGIQTAHNMNDYRWLYVSLFLLITFCILICQGVKYFRTYMKEFK